MRDKTAKRKIEKQTKSVYHLSGISREMFWTKGTALFLSKEINRIEAYQLVQKPWPNGLASRRKLKTGVYLRLRLARPCVHLR